MLVLTGIPWVVHGVKPQTKPKFKQETVNRRK